MPFGFEEENDMRCSSSQSIHELDFIKASQILFLILILSHDKDLECIE
jgi:hypothetical protein